MKLSNEHAYRMRVCIECYGTAANGSDWEVEDDDTPLALVPDDHDVTLGWLDDDDPDDDLGFSWTSCDACGSRLGGDRFKMTGWEPPA